MTIPDFADLDLAGRFAASFHAIREANVRTLIIDLRINSGGYDELNVELLSYLVRRPFRIYEGFSFRARDWDALKCAEYSPDDFWNTADLSRLTEAERAETLRTKTLAEALDCVSRTSPAAGTHQPKEADVFAGDLYFLCNGRSNSSGGEIPAFLHFLGVGTLIGEEPNAAHQGTTAGTLLTATLPNSGLRANFPLIAYQNAVLLGLFPGHGAPPHFTGGETLEDATQGRDTALEFALQLIAARSR